MLAEIDSRAGMSPIVKTAVRLVAGFILLFGAYIVAYGHLTPGGGFAGGVIIACSPILLLLACGRKFVRGIVGDRAVTIWDCVGALAFLAIAAAGYWGGAFFQNFWAKGEAFHLFSAGAMPLSNAAIGVKVGACLFGVFCALAAFRPTAERKG